MTNQSDLLQMAVEALDLLLNDVGRASSLPGAVEARSTIAAIRAATPDPASPAPSVEPTDAHLWMLWDRLPVKTPIALARVAIKEFATSPAAPSPSQGEALDAARWREVELRYDEAKTSRASLILQGLNLADDYEGRSLADHIDAAMRKGA
jgi:hypothetical protein